MRGAEAIKRLCRVCCRHANGNLIVQLDQFCAVPLMVQSQHAGVAVPVQHDNADENARSTYQRYRAESRHSHNLEAFYQPPTETRALGRRRKLDQMRIFRGIRLPETEMFPCSRRRIRELFTADELSWVSFGSPIRSFRFDNQVSHRPRLVGPVVVSLSVDRERQASLCVFPVFREAYPKGAQDELSEEVLPRFAQWLKGKRAQPITAILGHEQIIAEWASQKHRCHELLRFL